MNALIAGVVGMILAGVGVVGGVTAYQGTPSPTPPSQLTQYADE